MVVMASVLFAVFFVCLCRWVLLLCDYLPTAAVYVFFYWLFVVGIDATVVVSGIVTASAAAAAAAWFSE